MALTNLRSDSSVLVLSPGYSGADGLSCLTRELSSALARSASVEVWSLMDERSEFVDEHGPRVQGASGSRARFVGWAVHSMLAGRAPGLVVILHVHLSPLGILLASRGHRYVHVLIGIESWRRLSPLQQFALRRSDEILSISHYTESRFKAANPVFGDRLVSVCHPGIAWTGGPVEARPVGYALTVGRMSSAERYKGHDDLLRIWPQVVARSPDAKLIVAGEGDDRARLERLARDAGLSEAVEFVGRVTDEVLVSLYAACAFFVMPSAEEGFGLVFLEAMRAGKPCIGGVGAANEIIENRVTGFVVNPGDDERLKEAVETLWSQRRLRESMGAAGRRRFETTFTADRFAERLLRTLSLPHSARPG